MRHIGLLLGEHAAPSRVAATMSVLLGALALAGWMLKLPALASVVPGSAEMKANTGVSLMLCGIALWILAEGASLRATQRAQLLSMVVVILGLATLAEYYFGWELGIDELLVKDPAGTYALFRGRMSPFTAGALAAIGSALVAMPHRKLYGIAGLGAICGMLVGVTSLLGYAWNAVEIVTDHWLPPVAPNTAACLALLGGGILLAPKGTGSNRGTRAAALAATELKILAGFLVSMSLLLVGASYTYRASARFLGDAEWISHTHEVRTSLASLYGSLAGAELAIRDYVRSTDTEHRNEYRSLVDDVQQQLGNLKRLTADNPEQTRNLAALQPIVSARLAAMTSELVAYTDFGLEAARAIIAVDRDTNSTQQVRALTARMDAVEETLLAVRRQATANARKSTLISLLLMVGLATALFSALFRGIRRETLARRDAEDALRGSEQYNRSIVDSSPDCLSVHALDGRIMQMTPQGRRLMEMPDELSVSQVDWLQIWQGADRSAATAAVDAARNGRDGRFQGYFATMRGTPKWWDVIIMPILGADGRPERLLAVARDISDVKRSESELLEANRFLDSLIENLPVMVVVKDAVTLRFVRLNRAFERSLGYSRDELMGKTAADLFAAEEAQFTTATDRQALEQGGLLDIPEHQIHTDRLGVRTFNTMKMPIGHQDGAPQFLLAISVDITERKLAEQAIQALNSALEAKAEQLMSINKELESFSYSVSHDLRAPLRAIDGFALMIAEDCSERLDDEGRRYLAVIRENSKRMGALIDDLLAFSRLGRLSVTSQPVDVESLVREVIDEALNGHDMEAPGIEIGPLPPAWGDRGLLRQVWTNLISNAIKYSGRATRPRIEISGRRNATENLYSVKDNGVGFDMAYADKLFGVFQRLHRADEFGGTGVGLAIVHRVVTRHGGRVWAEAKVDEGALFSFTLPMSIDNE